jgi:hypothetical protein
MALTPDALIASFLLATFLAAFPRSLPSPLNQPPRFGVCQREGLKIAGAKPVAIGKSIRPPKRTRYQSPHYPDLPEGTSISGGLWIGEVLVDAKGKIAEVWPIREVRLAPAFPPFNESIVAAIHQWEYESLIVESHAVPWCMTVTVNIDLR